MRMTWRRAIAAGVFVGIGMGSVPAGAQTVIGFEDLPPGRIVNNQYSPLGVIISADNVNTANDIATLYPSDRTGGEDYDLEAPFRVGNRAGQFHGNVLIIQDHDNIGVTGSNVNRPDDENTNPAGSLFFHFATPATEFGFDLFDVDTNELSPTFGYIAFRSGTQEARVQFSQFTNPSSPFYNPTVVFGDQSANRIRPITASQLGFNSFHRVEINFAGSGAVDNIAFDVIPEPASLALVAGALPLLGLRRRRHQQ